jgi:hypothetical protein
MASLARILGTSLLTSGLGAGLGMVLFGQYPYSDSIILSLFLACVGGIIGAVAGAAREIVAALSQKTYTVSKTYRDLEI